MSLEEKLQNHYQSFKGKSFLERATVLALSKDGRVYGQLGKKQEDKNVQSLGALLVGMWQASEAVEGFLGDQDSSEMALSFQNSSKGFYILKPSRRNPDVFWGILFEGEVNPGKIKVFFKKLREHFDTIEILSKKEISKDENGNPLFQNITDEEVDELFSFAGL